MAKGDYEEAAKKYIELVDEEPKHEFADKALNNAAVCYENTRRFDSRAQALRAHLPRVPQQQAGRRGAVPRGGERRELVRLRQGGRELPAAGEGLPGVARTARPRCSTPPACSRASSATPGRRRLPALRRPVPQGRRRAQEPVPRRADLREAERLRRARSARSTSSSSKFASKADQARAGGRRAASASATRYQKLGNDEGRPEGVRGRRRRVRQARAEAGRRAASPPTPPPQSRFQLAEYEFKEFDKLKIGGTGKALEKSFTAKRDGGEEGATTPTTRCFKYKRLEWTLAALYRQRLRAGALRRRPSSRRRCRPR